MIVYKIDKHTHIQTNTQIKDMASVLEEIPLTLQTLKDIITEQESAFSSPAFNDFRDELQRRVSEAIRLTGKIAEDSQRLAAISNEASKHLLAVEEHFGSMLRKTNQPTQPQLR